METSIIAEKYQLLALIRRVGESDYYRATNLLTHELVVLRTINIAEQGAVGIGLESLAEDKLRRKMANEKRIFARLNQHSGVLEMLDVGFDDPLYYYVHPDFTFENLQLRLDAQQRLPVLDALQVMAKVADTLAHLHADGIIHCDVTAETVLLLGEQAKLIEFTIANHEQVAGAAPGTPSYMCPEAIMGATPTAAWDVWGLGVTLYYALIGRLPFGAIETGLPRGAAAGRLFQKILQDEPAPLTEFVPDAPPALSALLSQLLDKDPQQRLQPMRRVHAALAQIRQTLA